MGEGCEISVKECNEEENEVMDTPEKSKNNQIATSIGNFEESPVFNFLNNLSPIKPVKSVHITQTINPLSFASLPSVFTSPHVSSLRGSRFLPRHLFSNPSKPEFSSDVGNNPTDSSNVNMYATKRLENQQGYLDPPASEDEVAGQPSHKCSNGTKFKHDCNIPNSPIKPRFDLESKHMAEYACTSSELVYGSEVNLETISEIDQNKEATSCGWESLIADSSDMLVFESPNDTVSRKESIDIETSFYARIGDDMPHTNSLCLAHSGDQVGDGIEPESLCILQSGEGTEMMENAEIHDMFDSSLINNPSEEHLSSLYRGMRRRCLIFEMSGSHRKHFDGNLAPESSAVLQSDCNSSANNLQLVSTKMINESPRCVLPSIGLHLNALGTTSKDYKILNLEASASGRLLIAPSSSANFHPPTTGQDFLENNLAVASLGGDIDTLEDCVLPPMEDAFHASEYMADDEKMQSSPKKKRRRLEQSGEGDSCKRCNCKKSKCLKLYCECFAAGVYCVEPCACIDCFNKPIHEDTVLSTRKQIESRNPLAFAPKVIRGSESVIETGVRSRTFDDDSINTPASARHKRGCNCKKSGCLKKYCECYQGGVGCSINCRCEGCKNAFGRKDGSVVIGTEAEYEEDETDTAEKCMLDRTFQKPAIQTDHRDQNMDSAPPATPLLAGREQVHHPFSNQKPPRSSFLSIGSSSSSYASQMFKKPSFHPAVKMDKQLEIIKETGMPEFLQETSPTRGIIKSSSPNSKRISPPHSLRITTGPRSSRKLILQSIPSFPSLTPNP